MNYKTTVLLSNFVIFIRHSLGPDVSGFTTMSAKNDFLRN